MADDTSDPRRRRPPTIDLKATEIASAPANAEAPDPARETPGGSAPEAGAAAAEPNPAAPATPWLRDRLGGWRPGWSSVRLVAAGTIGAAVMLAALGAMWASGAFGPRDDLNVLMLARLAMLEQQVHELAKPQAGPDQHSLDALTGRVTALEALRGRIAELDGRLARIEPLGNRLAGLETRLGKVENAAPSGVAADRALTERIGALEAALRDAKARADAAYDAAQKNAAPSAAAAAGQKETEALAARIGALEQAVKATDEKLARTGSGTDRPARLAFAALALRIAVEQGDPFARELAAARPLADPALIAPLAPFAATGVPRAATLAHELSELAKPMRAAASPEAAREGIFGRLQQNAAKLVRVRPLNETAGDDPAALIARADAKASRGDLPGAIAELNRLPDTVRAPAQAWIARAQAQTAALAAARKLAETSAAALAP